MKLQRIGETSNRFKAVTVARYFCKGGGGLTLYEQNFPRLKCHYLVILLAFMCMEHL